MGGVQPSDTTVMRAGLRKSLPPAVVVLAALGICGSAGAHPATFKGKVCGLVAPKVIATVPGVSTACTEEAPLQAPGGKDYVGTWKGLTPTTSLGITIESFSDTGLLVLARTNLKQGLVGQPKNVAGIGDEAYEAKGTGSVDIKADVGKYIATITLTSVKSPPKSPAEIAPVAKAVVAALQ